MDPRVKAYQKQTPPRSEAAQPVPDPPPSLLKTTVPGPASPDRSLRKVAKFLILLGQAEAAQVVRHLDTAQVEALGREIADIQGIEPVEAEQILKEFGYLAAQKLGGVQGGPGTARAILDQAFGTERARQVLDRAVPGAVDKPFAFFAGMEPELVTALLGAESPQVHSVVVPFLEKAQAAAFLKTLEPSRRLDLVKRLAKMEQVPSAVVAQVEQALQERYHDLKPAQTEAVDGKARLADILRHMSVNGEQTILQALGEEKPELSDDLRRRLFTAADLLRVGDDGFEELLRGATTPRSPWSGWPAARPCRPRSAATSRPGACCWSRPRPTCWPALRRGNSRRSCASSSKRSAPRSERAGPSCSTIPRSTSSHVQTLAGVPAVAGGGLRRPGLSPSLPAQDPHGCPLVSDRGPGLHRRRLRLPDPAQPGGGGQPP